MSTRTTGRVGGRFGLYQDLPLPLPAPDLGDGDHFRDGVSGSNSGFHPNYFVDISDWFDRKVQVMKAYGSERFPLSRSEDISGFSDAQGVMAGTCYAEGFMLLKWVISEIY